MMSACLEPRSSPPLRESTGQLTSLCLFLIFSQEFGVLRDREPGQGREPWAITSGEAGSLHSRMRTATRWTLRPQVLRTVLLGRAVHRRRLPWRITAQLGDHSGCRMVDARSDSLAGQLDWNSKYTQTQTQTQRQCRNEIIYRPQKHDQKHNPASGQITGPGTPYSVPYHPRGSNSSGRCLGKLGEVQGGVLLQYCRAAAPPGPFPVCQRVKTVRHTVPPARQSICHLDRLGSCPATLVAPVTHLRST